MDVPRARQEESCLNCYSPTDSACADRVLQILSAMRWANWVLCAVVLLVAVVARDPELISPTLALFVSAALAHAQLYVVLNLKERLERCEENRDTLTETI